MRKREVVEGVQVQGEDEVVYYSITTTPWASAPANVSVVVKDAMGNDVSDDVLSGTLSVAGDLITLPSIGGLTAGGIYRVEVQFTAGPFVPAECFFYIRVEE